ncbi:hypothetical protein GCM10011501_09190 [Thalassotalea profundi]|uniref:Uncharacterized protein n=1 Tax=Thalassotalea profundi TaxID=2036687 RepID=A0ABQ3IFT7_9GAMM|nr:hypothetical protein GCM10011501_09190 [Thalassotalea profundi]
MNSKQTAIDKKRVKHKMLNPLIFCLKLFLNSKIKNYNKLVKIVFNVSLGRMAFDANSGLGK